MFGPGDPVPATAKATTAKSSVTRNAGALIGSPPQLTTITRGASCTILLVPEISTGEWVRAWRPSVPGISEVFHARFIKHHYPLHTHDDWTVFVVDGGAIRYDLDRRDRGVGCGLVTLLPPNVVHDGRPGTVAGFRKRVLYIGTDVIPERLTGRAVDNPDIRDPELLMMVGQLHGLLERPNNALAAESSLAAIGERIRIHLGERVAGPADSRHEARLAASLRDVLEVHLFEPMTLGSVGRSLGVTTPQLVRMFKRIYGITPHQYIIGRRIDTARKLLLDGQPVVKTATDLGFHDQAHFTRHFKRHVGESPARFARSHRRRFIGSPS